MSVTSGCVANAKFAGVKSPCCALLCAVAISTSNGDARFYFAFRAWCAGVASGGVGLARRRHNSPAGKTQACPAPVFCKPLVEASYAPAHSSRDSFGLARVTRPSVAYQRYATDIWYWRPAIGRPMNTPPVAAPGTRTLPSVKPRVSVTLLPLAVTSQWSPTCRLAPMSTMS